MAENEKKNDGLNISRRDFFKLAGAGAVAYAAAALSGGTVSAAEKTVHGSRARNSLKDSGSGNKGKADLLILGNVITMKREI